LGAAMFAWCHTQHQCSFGVSNYEAQVQVSKMHGSVKFQLFPSSIHILEFTSFISLVVLWLCSIINSLGKYHVRQIVTLKLSVLLDSSVDQFEYLIPLYCKLG